METPQNEREIILALLDNHGVPYRLYAHQRAFTIDDCRRMPFIHEDVTICKNVFLCNRQQTHFYLMLLRPGSPFRTAVVSKALGVSRLSFVPTGLLPRLLRVEAGAVSPFSLYFDTERRIALCYEQAVKDTAEIAFHPCDNAATVVFSQSVFWERVLPLLGVEPVPVEAAEPGYGKE